MPGLIVFKSMAEAVRAGFQGYEKYYDPKLGCWVERVRTRTTAGYALALVIPQRHGIDDAA